MNYIFNWTTQFKILKKKKTSRAGEQEVVKRLFLRADRKKQAQCGHVEIKKA